MSILTQMKYKTLLFASLVLTSLAGLGFAFFPSKSVNKVVAGAVEDAASDVPPAEDDDVYPHEIPPRTSLYTVLRGMDVPSALIHQLVAAAKPVTDLGSLRSGTRFQVKYTQNNGLEELSALRIFFSPVERLEIKNISGDWKAEKISLDVETRVVTFQGTVESTLWESAERAKMDPNLIADLAEIFAWQVDFAREVRVNDRWRISVEQKLVRGKPYAWGAITVAEYENAGELHKAILYQVSDNERGYYSPDGNSLRRMFLKSPIKYGRISSRFNKKRFHPILKTRRPHLGVDYAAPTGTPIRAVGDGVVTTAAWRGGGGKTIMIRHNATYKTAYKHLHGYAKGIRMGAKVRQGQIIGYVGSTGLSTGPHLHFEFYQSGRFVDPLGQKFPSADPIPAGLLGQFQQKADQLLTALPAWERVTVAAKDNDEKNRELASDQIAQ